MNAVTTLRTAMAMLTGILGILGTIIETRHKTTRRVTKGGWIVLFLIFVSMIIGVVAQLKESSEEERAKNAEAMQTYELVKKSDQTLIEIQRVLTPLDDLRIDFSYQVTGCKGKYSGEFCQMLHGMQLDENKILKPNSSGDFAIEVHIFRDQNQAQKFLQEGDPIGDSLGDIVFVMDSVQTRDTSKTFDRGPITILDPGSHLDVPHLNIFGAHIRDMIENDGRIISIQDLHGCTLLLISQQILIENLVLEKVHMFTKAGPGITITKFEKLPNYPKFGDTVVYRSVIP